MRRKRKKKTLTEATEPIKSETLKEMVLANEDANEHRIGLIMSANKDRSGDRATAAVQLYIAGVAVKKISEVTGLAENSVYRILKRYREKPEFRQKVDSIADYMPQMYLTMKKLEVLRYDHADNLALAEYEKNPEMLLRHPGYMKLLKQSAKVLPQDDVQVIKETINVDKLMMLVQQDLKIAAGQAIDGEVIEPEQIDDDSEGDSSKKHGDPR